MSRTACLALLIFSSSATAGENDLAAKLKDVKFEHYAKAPGYSEGPSWRNGELFFCSGALLRVDKDRKVTKFLDINPAGTVFRSDGHLLICDNKHRALLDYSPDGTLGVLADKFDGKPLGSLNDLTLDKAGNIYWTDPEGSSLAKPVGKFFRLSPDGAVSKVAEGLAFPNGLDVDPRSEFLYLIESQSKKILRYRLPEGNEPLGKAEMFFDLGGSGGDGCTFDAEGNFWVADFHRPETKQGRITVLSPAGKVLAHLPVPAQVVSNIAFGGPNHDEIFCTTGNPPGVFRAKVGVKGFVGHPGKPMKPIRTIPVKPEETGSAVHPRRFGSPGGVGPSRGWFLWRKFDKEKGLAEISHEATGETFTSRVLPWATTYRYLVYGASPEELLPGERVNIFFSPDERHRRGYLVHYQDELCQMKGHGHSWQVLDSNGDRFKARVMAGDKPLDDRVLQFQLAPKCKHWRAGKEMAMVGLTQGGRLYLTWTEHDKKRTVHLTCDDASTDALKKVEQAAVHEHLAEVGLGAHVEAIEGDTVQLLVFPTFWSQAGQWKEGQLLTIRQDGSSLEGKLISRKNLGAYGSGSTEVRLQLKAPTTTLTVGKQVSLKRAS